MNLKYIYSSLTTISLCLLSVVSCRQMDDVLQFASGREMTIDLASRDLESKGAPVTPDNLLDVKGSLNISAYGADSPLFEAKELSYDSVKESWVIAGNPEWPEDEIERFSFWAWSDNGEGAGKISPSINAERTEMSFSYTVPSAPSGSRTSAEVQPDILLAQTAKAHLECPDGKVKLNMLHALSALNFEVDANINPGVLDSIKITGVLGSGDCVFDGKDFIWTAKGEPCDYCQEFEEEYEGNEDITARDSVKTFMMIPQTLAGAKISITFIPEGASVPETLTASFPDGDFWSAGDLNMYVIANDGIRYKGTILSWEEGADKSLPLVDTYYNFEVSNNNLVFTNTTATLARSFNISSYSQKGGRKDGYNDKVAVKYDAEYSIDGGQNWLPFDATATGISGLNATGNSGTTTEITAETPTTKSLTAAVRQNEAISQFKWVDDPVTASNWDLSKCDIGGEYNVDNYVNTANCYIVKHPGSYTLPCVYGNAIKNGSPSDAGYRFAYSSSNEHLLKHFLNSKGEPISSPYVLADVVCSKPKAALMWCDAKDDADTLVQNVTLHNAGTPESAYISFNTMDGSKMVEGNAVLVLYDDVNEDNKYSPCNTNMKDRASLLKEDVALWSWHIWVSANDLSESSAFELSSNVVNSDPGFIMTKPLGWAAPNGSTRYYVSDGYKSFVIRLKQQSGDAGYRYVYINQPDIVLDENASATYFQGGRKDPIVGGFKNGTSFKSKAMYGDVESVITTTSTSVFPTDKKEESAKNIIALTLSRPDLLCATGYGVDNFYLNCWSMNNDFGREYNKPTVKTVYDPSPYGYVIPSERQFRNITNADLYRITEYGCVYNKGVFLPYTGFRSETSTLAVTSFNTEVLFWTSCPDKSDVTKYARFEITTSSLALDVRFRNRGYAVLPVIEQATE